MSLEKETSFREFQHCYRETRHSSGWRFQSICPTYFQRKGRKVSLHFVWLSTEIEEEKTTSRYLFTSEVIPSKVGSSVDSTWFRNHKSYTMRRIARVSFYLRPRHIIPFLINTIHLHTVLQREAKVCRRSKRHLESRLSPPQITTYCTIFFQRVCISQHNLGTAYLSHVRLRSSWLPLRMSF